MRIALRVVGYGIAPLVLAYLSLRTSWPAHCSINANCGLGAGYAELGSLVVYVAVLAAAYVVELVAFRRRMRARAQQA